MCILGLTDPGLDLQYFETTELLFVLWEFIMCQGCYSIVCILLIANENRVYGEWIQSDQVERL